jgi:hypothetical protein
MRTTIDLPDELLTELKVLCAQQRSSLKNLITELLFTGLRNRGALPKPPGLSQPYRPRIPLSGALMERMRSEGRR